MDKVRAKFRIQSVKQADYGNGNVVEEVEASPVYKRGSDGCNAENAIFGKHTPMGKLTMTLNNPDVHGFFKAGGEYYLDFTPAEEASEASA